MPTSASIAMRINWQGIIHKAMETQEITDAGNLSKKRIAEETQLGQPAFIERNGHVMFGSDSTHHRRCQSAFSSVFLSLRIFSSFFFQVQN